MQADVTAWVSLMRDGHNKRQEPDNMHVRGILAW
jgi:hypothetical protein